MRGRFAASLEHITQAIEITGACAECREQGHLMATTGRCFFARAGKLDQSLMYAARAREAGVALGDSRLRAWRAAEAEPYLYKGLWDEAVEAAEQGLPDAWEIMEWPLVLWSSGWLAIAYLKLAREADAQALLERAIKAAPHSLGYNAYALAYAQIALAEVNLAAGRADRALNDGCQGLQLAQQVHAGLEEGAALRVIGQIHTALGNRSEADAAFRRSLEVLEEIQSPPELAQTLLAFGRFRRGDNALQDRAMIERALALFEEMNATGWIEEARAALRP